MVGLEFLEWFFLQVILKFGLCVLVPQWLTRVCWLFVFLNGVWGFGFSMFFFFFLNSVF